MHLIKIFFVFYSIFQIRALRTLELEIVKSISDVLQKKQIIIIKNIPENPNYKEFLSVIKYFSSLKIYVLFRSTKEMEPALMELVAYGYPTYKYNPRTIAVIDKNDLPEIASIYFNVSFLKLHAIT